MTSGSALVVGGTGPTGPAVVEGLLERGFEVTIFHSGVHEVDFAGAVAHLHGDPHFAETIGPILAGRSWDVAIVQYGRLVHLVEALAGNVGHLVAIGGANRLLASVDAPVWGDAGKPAVVDGAVFADSRWFEDDPARNGFGTKIARAHARLFELAGAARAFDATYLAYPLLYGPRQPACREWSVVRRILDGRRRLVLADGGLKLQSVGFTENVAVAPLLVVDARRTAAGKTYFVGDRELHSYRRRVELIAADLGADIEIVSMPFDVATPSHALYGAAAHHRAIVCRRVGDDLGYTERWTVAQGLGRTVDWLTGLDHSAIAELEHQLGDPFAYPLEDALLRTWDDAFERLLAAGPPAVGLAHPYRHPTEPDEAWTRRELRGAP